jgi:capsular exopolysaccharide synthesis family protein
MNREITLTSSSPGLSIASDDLWAQGTQLASAAQQQPQPLKKLHRLLRGRYWLAITLAVIGLCLGAIGGWVSQVPLYQSDGLIEIRPYMPSTAFLDKPMPFYQNFVKSQAMLIQGPRVIEAAMKRPEWTEAGGWVATPEHPERAAAFGHCLTANYIKDSAMVQISFQCDDKRLAKAGADAVMQAYLETAEDVNNDAQSEKLETAQKLKQQASDNYRKDEDIVNELSKEYGSPDLGPLLVSKQELAQKLQSDLWRMKYERELAEATIPGPDGKTKVSVLPLTTQQLAQANPTLAAALQNQQALMDKLSLLQTQNIGPNNPQYQRTKALLDETNRSVEALTKQTRAEIFSVLPTSEGNGTMQVTPQTIEFLKNREQAASKQLEAVQGSIQTMGARKRELDKWKTEMSKLQDQMTTLDKNIDSLEASMAVSGQIILQGLGTEPITPSTDKRKQFAVLGGVVGGGLPFGIIMLIGLLDSRYRYSDETDEAGVSGLPLLGILPNLPDKLSDPAQASIAAHCVHQIRTMLQINTSGDRRALSITSAVSGDGKTSLSLALGLSFASAGSRTLLIDADLVGAGLTGRLGMNGPEGILEAMTSGNLLHYVRSTDVADLSILPVGMAQLHHAGIFSPASVRRLINEAKKHFEMILIDTGPILGSIEATPVAAAADGVILTVARGRERSMVAKALAHLTSIGAFVAGVVFNRAQDKDFESSISGISMRSAGRASSGGAASNGSGPRAGQAGQYGPVARAVATSVRPTDGAAKN